MSEKKPQDLLSGFLSRDSAVGSVDWKIFRERGKITGPDIRNFCFRELLL